MLNVKNIGLILSEDKSIYNDSILDGELIFIRSKNRYLFMFFDCLFKSGKDIRPISSFIERLGHGDEIIEKCFILKGQKGFKYKEYDGEFNIPLILKFQGDNIKKFMESINNDINYVTLNDNI